MSGVFWVVFVSPLFWLSVTMPKLFRDDAVARGAARFARVLVKPQPEMEQGCVTHEWDKKVL